MDIAELSQTLDIDATINIEAAAIEAESPAPQIISGTSLVDVNIPVEADEGKIMKTIKKNGNINIIADYLAGKLYQMFMARVIKGDS